MHNANGQGSLCVPISIESSGLNGLDGRVVCATCLGGYGHVANIWIGEAYRPNVEVFGRRTLRRQGSGELLWTPRQFRCICECCQTTLEVRGG